MNGESDKAIEEKLDTLIELTQYLVALELSRQGATHQAIGKHIHVAKATVGRMLAGTKKETAT